MASNKTMAEQSWMIQDTNNKVNQLLRASTITEFDTSTLEAEICELRNTIVEQSSEIRDLRRSISSQRDIIDNIERLLEKFMERE